MTSHQLQPLMHPNTFTVTPPGNQVTSGNPRSGPARMLTACVVNAICAPAGMENIRNKAARRCLCSALGMKIPLNLTLQLDCITVDQFEGTALATGPDSNWSA